MVVFESLAEIHQADADLVGSKAKALAALAGHGFEVPSALCISAECYGEYMAGTSLHDRVLFELGRKAFEDMRWEEIWDAALRIRNLFLCTPLPPTLHTLLHEAVGRVFGDAPVVIRSSAPGEDSAEASFAGLHESFVNVRGPSEILKHIRLVWASLWSDAALLYRQELGLDVRRSRMAVIVQAIAEGDCSGVVFSRDPGGADQVVIEAVHGLNAGLVDGTIEPDRWTVDRDLGRITSHTEPERGYAMIALRSGIERQPLDSTRAQRAPLSNQEVMSVYELALAAEGRCGVPQDVEWTWVSGALCVLQSRPITTLSHDAGDDKRAWYRSLTKSFENLKVLRQRIEEQIVPGMQREADALARIDLASLTDDQLIVELKRREAACERWREVYWSDCIPFAHGVRLFGQYYNDSVQPQNPYEFMDLLAGTDMLSVARNQALEALAQMLRDSSALRDAVRSGDEASLSAEFKEAIETFSREHGDITASTGPGTLRPFLSFVLELARASATGADKAKGNANQRCRDFLLSVSDTERGRAEEMLDLARASHRWRDDDNIYLDAVEAQWRFAGDEALRRGLACEDARGLPGIGTGEDSLEHREETRDEGGERVAPVPVQERQLVGQPAGPGVAVGLAHVVAGPEDLLGFKRGDVLVCDALSPTMTFVIPLAGGVVERRGGMLIHGAIIAREYGIPCVTGVPDATTLIRSGMHLTVDGYLGIVRVDPQR